MSEKINKVKASTLKATKERRMGGCCGKCQSCKCNKDLTKNKISIKM